MDAGENRLPDSHGRVARYMRVSLTDACNYRCGFCMPEKSAGHGGEGCGGARLACGELLRLCGIFVSLGVNRFKVTGGEPFMAPDAMTFMTGLKTAGGVLSLTVTTNGSTLDRHAAELAALGVDGVNVSINAMTQAGYENVTGTQFSLRRVLDNILLAKEAGLRVKLNMVPLSGVNEDDIPQLLEFALPQGIPVRFIELMPIGQGRRYAGLTFDEVRTIIETRFGKAAPVAEQEQEGESERPGNGPARYLSLPGFAARVGYIASVSRRFCASCDRLRLNSAGFLRTCLHHGHGGDLSPLLRSGLPDVESEEHIARRIREIVAEKPDGHHFENRYDEYEENSGAGDEPMHRIGG